MVLISSRSIDDDDDADGGGGDGGGVCRLLGFPSRYRPQSYVRLVDLRLLL